MSISTKGTEYVQCFAGGGTKNEYFSHHFDLLVEHLLAKYPERQIVMLMDNLLAHKSEQVVKVAQDY